MSCRAGSDKGGHETVAAADLRCKSAESRALRLLAAFPQQTITLGQVWGLVGGYQYQPVISCTTLPEALAVCKSNKHSKPENTACTCID